jgi:hypothetical protein
MRQQATTTKGAGIGLTFGQKASNAGFFGSVVESKPPTATPIRGQEKPKPQQSKSISKVDRAERKNPTPTPSQP